MAKFIYIIILTIFLSSGTAAQISPLAIDKVDSVMAQEARPILILLSTDWCKYCNMQKYQVQKNRNFRDKSSNFYYVEFDAESEQKIPFQQRDFEFSSSARTHELAIALNGTSKISFPTWVLLDTAYQVLYKHNGVLTPKHLDKLLQDMEERQKNK